jgi:prevent-host-death family protein
LRKYYVNTNPPSPTWKNEANICVLFICINILPQGDPSPSLLPPAHPYEMYNTEGVDSVATITELRSETSDLIDHVRNTNNGILIQKNNEPHAVLISWETYKAIKEKVNLDEI